MAEILKDENPRKDLYRMLLADKTPGVADKIKKYSFNQFEKHLLSNENAQNELGWYLEKKGVVSDPTDFSQRYIQESVAPPTPKPQAAPIAPAPVEEEPYVPEPQPAIGSPEYDAQLQAQYGGMAPTLGATFAGTPAAFETKAQKKQEQISPAFKAQQLAFEDVPIAEEQRRAQRQFAKATKQQQQAALMGGTGAELAQKREDEKLTKAQIVGEEANKFLSGLNRAIYKTPSAMAKTVGELGVGVINMLGGDMKSEESVLYNLADKYDKWLDTSEVARDWIGDPQYSGLATDIGSGLGQIATMIAAGPGGASRTLMSSPGVIKSVAQKMFSKPSLIAGAQVFNSEYENMKAKGESDETAFKQALTNWFATAPLENLPIVNLAERLNKTVGVQATRRVINAIQQGAEEGGQEALQQLFSNFSNNALVEINKNVVDWTEGLQPSAEAGGVVGLLIGALANAKAAKGYSKPSGLSAFSPAVQENPITQIATRNYQKNISRAEEQGKKPDKWDVKQLEKLRNDPEAWLKGEVKYLTQKIEEDKKANIDTKVTEADLAEHNALLAQIKAEKKGVSGAAPVAAEAPVAPAETIEVAPETAAPITEEDIAEEVPPVTEEAPAEVVTAPTGMFEGIEGPQAEEEENFIVEPDSELSQKILDNGEQVLSRLDAEKRIGDGERLFGFNEQDDSLVELSLQNLGAFPIDTIIAVRPEVIEEAPVAQAEEVVAAAPAAPAPKGVKDMSLEELKAESKVFDEKIKAEKERLKRIAPTRQIIGGADIENLSESDAARYSEVNDELARRTTPSQEEAKRRVAEKREQRRKEQETPTGKQIDKKSVQTSLDKAKEEYEKAKGAFDKKRSELDKTTREDVKDLFGERKVEMKAQGLFEMPRISPGQREKAIQPFRDRMNKAKEEVNRLTKMLEEGEEVSQKISFNKAVEEIKSKPLSHVFGIKMGSNQAEGTYISTEKENRYAKSAPNAKISKAEVSIENPLVVTDDIGLVDLRNKILNRNLVEFTEEDFELYEIPDEPTVDDLNDSGVAKLSKLVTKDLKAKGYDSIYFPESKMQEGELIVFDRKNVKFTEYEQVQGAGKETRKGKGTPKAKGVVRPKAKPVRNAGKSPDAITARTITIYGDPYATSLQYLMDATYHPDLLEAIFGGPSRTTKSGRKDISGERKSRIQFLDKNSPIKTADRLAEILAERYAEENNIDVKDAEQQHDFASIATDIISSYASRNQMVREVLRLNEQQSEEFDFMYNPEDIYGEGYNEDIAKEIDGIMDELPDSYWEGKEITDEEFGNLFAEEEAPSFTSQQSSEAATAFDKAKTSKGFDKKYGKGAYKALSDITKNFDAIMDKVSDKIKQDCL